MTRRLATTLLLCAVVLGCCALPAPGQTSSRAALRVTLNPLVVRGVYFRAAERVQVTVRFGSETRVRTAVANAQGSFTTSFGTIQYDRCSTGITALAVGRLGDRASYKLPQPLCAP